ncbi:MAG: hypothetical protein ACJ8M4_03840 [Chthoniobacterales bacterium]
MTESERKSPRFYFALPRLMSKWRGGDSTRAEKNSVEAWAAGIAIYIVSYLFFAAFVSAGFSWWLTALIFIGLAFGTWLFWLVVLYLNSFVIKLLRFVGLIHGVPDRYVQSVLISATATAMAVSLATSGSWMTEIAALWIIAVTMNLAAAAILALQSGRP